MISRNTPTTASFESGPGLSSRARRSTCASRSGRYAAPLFNAPIAFACAARSLKSRNRSRSIASIAERWRLSAASSSPLSFFAIRPAAPGRPRSLADLLAVLLFGLDDALEAGELFAFAEIDEGHALGRTAHLAYRFHLRADEHAAGGDEHHLVVLAHQRRRDDLSVALGLLDGDHAFRAARVPRVLDD